MGNNNDLIKAFWLNYIQPLSGKAVLKLGSENRENLFNLASLNPRSLACLGNMSEPLQIGSVNVEWLSNIDAAPLKTYDLVLLDEEKYLDLFDTSRAINQLLKDLSKLLKDDGVLIISCIKKLRHRYRITKALAKSGFIASRHLLSNSLSDNPVYVAPPFRSMKQAKCGLGTIYTGNTSLKEKIKHSLRLLFFLLTSIYNPYRELTIIATTRKDTLGNNMLDVLEKQIRLKNAAPDTFMTQCMVKDWTQFIFFHHSQTLVLSFLAKIYFPKLSMSDAVRREYENLLLLDHHRPAFNQRNIETPLPICRGKSLDGAEYTIQSAILGKSLDAVLNIYLRQGDNKHIMTILDSIYNVLESFHAICQGQQTTERIDWQFFESPLDNMPRYLQDAESWADLPMIQHGDFTTVNILYNASTDRWGIIDWESLRRGYPPLFDIFCLFASIRFMASHDIKIGNRFELYYESLICSFFRSNWFSHALRNYVERYCKHFNINQTLAFDYFIAFLVYHYNKFGFYTDYWPYKDVYENAIRFAVKNKKDFLGGIS